MNGVPPAHHGYIEVFCGLATFLLLPEDFEVDIKRACKCVAPGIEIYGMHSMRHINLNLALQIGRSEGDVVVGDKTLMRFGWLYFV